MDRARARIAVAASAALLVIVVGARLATAPAPSSVSTSPSPVPADTPRASPTAAQGRVITLHREPGGEIAPEAQGRTIVCGFHIEGRIFDYRSGVEYYLEPAGHPLTRFVSAQHSTNEQGEWRSDVVSVPEGDWTLVIGGTLFHPEQRHPITVQCPAGARPPEPTVPAGVGVGPPRVLAYPGCQAPCEAEPLIASRDHVVVWYRRGDQLERVVLDVATGRERALPGLAGWQVSHLRGTTAALAAEIVAADGRPERWRVARLDLSASSPQPTVLDDQPITVPLYGGDALRPSPDPVTNGRDVLWRRAMAAADGGEVQELVLQRGSAAPQVIHSARTFLLYSLAEDGRVAITDAPASGDATLILYDPVSGSKTELARRPSERGGLVQWVAGRIAWFEGYMNVRYADRADLFDPVTGRSTPLDPPPGCGLAPSTTRHVQVFCLDSSTFQDVVTGTIFTFPREVAGAQAYRGTDAFIRWRGAEREIVHYAVLDP